MKSIVINLIAGPGSGKSTTAADIFRKLKQSDQDCELVREYVKEWVYEGRKPSSFLDQIYVTNEQFRRESMLYNKVEYIVTDCPLVLGVVYDYLYNKKYNLINIVNKYLDLSKSIDIEHKYFFIKRNKKYNPKGRYQNEEEAKNLDDLILKTLDIMNISYTVIDCDQKEISNNIIKALNL